VWHETEVLLFLVLYVPICLPSSLLLLSILHYGSTSTVSCDSRPFILMRSTAQLRDHVTLVPSQYSSDLHHTTTIGISAPLSSVSFCTLAHLSSLVHSLLTIICPCYRLYPTPSHRLFYPIVMPAAVLTHASVKLASSLRHLLTNCSFTFHLVTLASTLSMFIPDLSVPCYSRHRPATGPGMTTTITIRCHASVFLPLIFPAVTSTPSRILEEHLAQLAPDRSHAALKQDILS
jgi:hypothetical protein